MADKEVLQFEIDSNIGELSKDIDKAADSTKKLDKAAAKASGDAKLKELGFTDDEIADR